MPEQPVIPPIVPYSDEWWERLLEELRFVHHMLVAPRDPPKAPKARALYEQDRREAEAMVQKAAKTPGMLERLHEHLYEMGGELLGTFEGLTLPNSDMDEDVLRIVRSRFERAKTEHNTLKAFAGAWCLIRDRRHGYPGEPWRVLLEGFYRDEELPQIVNRRGKLVHPKRPEYDRFDRIDWWVRNNSERGRVAKQKYDSQPKAKEKRKARCSSPEAQALLKKKRAEDYQTRKLEKPSKDAQAASVEQMLQQLDKDPKPAKPQRVVTKRAPRPVEPQPQEPSHEDQDLADDGSSYEEPFEDAEEDFSDEDSSDGYG